MKNLKNILFLSFLFFACGTACQRNTKMKINCFENKLHISTKGATDVLGCYTYQVKNSSVLLESASKKYVLSPSQTQIALKDIIELVSTCACYNNVSEMSEGHYIVARIKALGGRLKYTNAPNGLGTQNHTVLDSSITLTSFYIPKRDKITGVKWYNSTAGVFTADTTNRVGLYKYIKETKTLRLVAKSSDINDSLKVSAIRYITVPFIEPVEVTEGLYYVGLLHNRSAVTTAPAIAGTNTSNGFLGVIANLMLGDLDGSNIYLNMFTTGTNFKELPEVLKTTGSLFSKMNLYPIYELY